MNQLFAALAPLAFVATAFGRADSTIDPTAALAWASNIGWTNWRASAADGALIGEYVCSGSVFCANIGWVNLGSGTPADGIRYSNTIAGDYGVNFRPTSSPGIAALRGLAYGSNIGWINFENSGDPHLDLTTGEISGYAWSANCGWINLGTDTPHGVSTDSIAPAADSDNDGLADAFELENFSDLTTAAADTDSDGDGQSNLAEALAGTSPTSPNERLAIVDFAVNADGSESTLTWTSNAARFYAVEVRADLGVGDWVDSGFGPILPDTGTTTTLTLITNPSRKLFFRVKALLPFAP
jgi:hypothetical protein